MTTFSPEMCMGSGLELVLWAALSCGHGEAGRQVVLSHASLKAARCLGNRWFVAVLPGPGLFSRVSDRLCVFPNGACALLPWEVTQGPAFSFLAPGDLPSTLRPFFQSCAHIRHGGSSQRPLQASLVSCFAQWLCLRQASGCRGQHGGPASPPNSCPTWAVCLGPSPCYAPGHGSPLLSGLQDSLFSPSHLSETHERSL